MNTARSRRGLGWKLFVTRSDAMRPTIFAGDMVLVRRKSGSEHRFEIGDIVACAPLGDGAPPVVRRICGVMLSMCGDVLYLTRCERGVVREVIAHSDVPGGIHSVVSGDMTAGDEIIGEVTATFPNVGKMLHGRRSGSPFALSRWAPAPNARKKLQREFGLVDVGALGNRPAVREGVLVNRPAVRDAMPGGRHAT